MIEFIASNDLARVAVLFLIFLIVLGLVFLVAGNATRRMSVRSDLQKIASSVQDNGGVSRLTQNRDSSWIKLLDNLESAGLSLADTRGDELRKKMIAAGYTSPAAPRIFTLIRLVLVFVLPGFFLLLASIGNREIGIFQLYIFGVGLALAGLYLPNLVVAAKADRRQEAIRRGFPDCLDLMLVCVEAGLGLESAMDRVGREMVHSHPLVSNLLSFATLQMRAGAAREEALRKMGDLSGVDEIRSFSTLLIQSDKMGTSVADTLRVYAAEMREKRRLRAEEKAHRLPVLISIPLVVCMLPTMIGVLMIPGVVRAVRTLFPALTGG